MRTRSRPVLPEADHKPGPPAHGGNRGPHAGGGRGPGGPRRHRDPERARDAARHSHRRTGVVQGIVGTAGEISDLALGTEGRSARARAAARARTSFERWLTTGGVRRHRRRASRYISEMERWWRAEKERLPTSPHVLRRSMRLARVSVRGFTIRAPGRELNDTLTQAVAAAVQRSDAMRLPAGDMRSSRRLRSSPVTEPAAPAARPGAVS